MGRGVKIVGMYKADPRFWELHSLDGLHTSLSRRLFWWRDLVIIPDTEPAKGLIYEILDRMADR